MERNNRPLSREKKKGTGKAKVERKENGLGLGGPRGNSEGFEHRAGQTGKSGQSTSKTGTGRSGGSTSSRKPDQSNRASGISGGGSGGGVPVRAGGRNSKSMLLLIVGIVLVFLALRSFSGGSGGSSTSSQSSQSSQGQGFSGNQSSGQNQGNSTMNGAGNSQVYEDYQSGTGTSTGGFSGGSYTQQTGEDNTGTTDMQVANEARDKYTKLLGNGNDTVTIMVYMCGTDLESNYSMATSDLSEMAKAKFDENKVRIIVYTGGCKRWKNSIVSSQTNQIYQVVSGGLKRLESDLGQTPMVNYENLGAFIQYCAKYFPANRNELILWDHGGGTVSGYGYDEKYPSSGSMMLDKIVTGLKQGGQKFDFIGFDACLMATLETAILAEPYADYLIASEETEPGYGWYYTNWLTGLSSNTSVDTVSLGKKIADDFVQDNTSRRGGSTTLSVLDLAELSGTVPAGFSAFSSELKSLVTGSNYATVSNARARSREYASNTKIDQIDLINFCENLGTSASNQFAQILRGIVKYNVHSSDMTNSYGVSIYFPYRSLSYLSTVLKTYNSLALDSDYREACRQFASLQTGGQISSGGSSVSLDQLLGGYSSAWSQDSSGSYSTGSNYGSYGQGSSYGGYGGSNGTAEIINELLGYYLSGRSIAPERSVNGLTSANSDWIDSDLLENEETIQYIAENSINTGDLVWTELEGEDGTYKALVLSNEEWDLIQSVELNAFVDDGQGFIDLGLDNLFGFDEEGNLVGEWDGSWLALDGQIVPYYFMSATSDGSNYAITGRVPAMMGDEMVDIILEFTSSDPDGSVIGISKVEMVASEDGGYETPVQGKVIPFGFELEADDELGAEGEVFDSCDVTIVADYYTYDGKFDDSYPISDTITISADTVIENLELDLGDSQKADAYYRLTDIYNNHFWTPAADIVAE